MATLPSLLENEPSIVEISILEPLENRVTIHWLVVGGDLIVQHLVIL